MSQSYTKTKEGVVKLIPIPVTSGRELIVPPGREVKAEDKPYEWKQSSVEERASTEDWTQVLDRQSGKIREALANLTGVSLLFAHGPAIIGGIIIGLMCISWIGGLNEAAQLIVIGICILASEVVVQMLKKPHILVGVMIAVGAMSWIDGLNIGAKLIVLFVALCTTDILYQFVKKTWNLIVLRPHENRHL